MFQTANSIRPKEHLAKSPGPLVAFVQLMGFASRPLLILLSTSCDCHDPSGISMRYQAAHIAHTWNSIQNLTHQSCSYSMGVLSSRSLHFTLGTLDIAHLDGTRAVLRAVPWTVLVSKWTLRLCETPSSHFSSGVLDWNAFRKDPSLSILEKGGILRVQVGSLCKTFNACSSYKTLMKQVEVVSANKLTLPEISNFEHLEQKHSILAATRRCNPPFRGSNSVWHWFIHIKPSILISAVKHSRHITWGLSVIKLEDTELNNAEMLCSNPWYS